MPASTYIPSFGTFHPVDFQWTAVSLTMMFKRALGIRPVCQVYRSELATSSGPVLPSTSP